MHFIVALPEHKANKGKQINNANSQNSELGKNYIKTNKNCISNICITFFINLEIIIF